MTLPLLATTREIGADCALPSKKESVLVGHHPVFVHNIATTRACSSASLCYEADRLDWSEGENYTVSASWSLALNSLPRHLSWQ
jgi:hypothetical protein